MSRLPWRVPLLVLSLGVACLHVVMHAQTVNGAILGKVTDTDHLAVPGVTITVTSPNLITGRIVVVSDGDGTYRVPNLPPGTYVVSTSLSGYEGVRRENVLVPAGTTIAADFELKAGGVQESVTVVAETPTVDVTNTRVGINVDRSQLLNIPTGRTFSDILNMQPGVNESTYTFAPVNSVQGSNVRQNYYSMDGFQMQDAAVGYFIGDIDYDTIQEVQVTTGGISAEFGQASGGVFNFITKSGGDRFSGGARLYANSPGLTASNLTDELRAKGVTAPTSIKSRTQSSFDLGGPILRRRMWFYGDFGRTDYTQTVSALAGVVDPESHGWTDLAKVTWQANLSNQFLFSHQSRHDHWIPANADAGAVPDPAVLARYNEPADGSWIYNTRNQTNYLLQWTSTLSPRTLLQVRYGVNRGGGSDEETFPNADQTRAGYVDTTTGQDYGWWRSDRVNNERDAYVLKADLTHSVTAWGGHHDLKAGFEHERDPFRETLHYPESMVQVLQNGKPFQVQLYNEPISDARNVWRYSGYVQDQWQARPDLTFNLGVRYDRSEGWTPAQQYGLPLTGASGSYPQGQWFTPVEFPERRNIVTPAGVAPRLGVAWDVGGKHRVVSRFNYGRWYDRLLNVPNISGGSATYAWTDTNGDGRFQADERGALVSSTVVTDPNWTPAIVADPNRKSPYTDSFQVGVDWEVRKDVALSIVGTYKRDRDIIGTIDQGVPYDAYTAYTATNHLTGEPITLYLVDPAYRNVTRINWSTNPAGLKRTYKGVELVVKKRFSATTQFQVSSDFGRALGNVGTSFSASTAFANPNSLTNAYGPTDLDATAIVKAQGTYVAPFDIALSGTYAYNSGYPLDTTTTASPPGAPVVRYVRGVDYPSTAVEPNIDVPAQARGTIRQDPQHTVSFRAEKRFVTRQGTLGVMLDVFNLFNTASIINVSSLRTDAPTYLSPALIQQPRSARLGVRFEF